MFRYTNNRDIHQSVQCGLGCTIWAFSVLCADVVLEANVVIGSHCFVGKGCHLGEGTRLQSFVFLPPHTQIGAYCFLGPGVICTDDPYPTVKQPDVPLYTPNPPTIEHHASIGAGVIILPGIHIGAYALVGAGAVVTHDVPAGAKVCGNPARRMAGQQRTRDANL